MAKSSEERLEIDLGVRTEDAESSLSNFTEVFNRDYKRLEAIQKRHNKMLIRGTKDVFRLKEQTMRAEQSAQSQIKAATEQIGTVQKKLTEKMAERATAIATVTEKTNALNDAIRRGDAAAKSSAETELKVAQDQVEGIEAVIKAAHGLIEEYQQVREEAEDNINRIKKLGRLSVGSEFEFNFSEDAKEIGKDFGEAVSSIFSSNAAAAGEAIGKGVSKSLQKGISSFAERFRARQEEKAKKAGKVDASGAPQLGKLAGGFSKLLSSISSLIPLLNVFTGGLGGLVKMFLDAEAAAKGFNKDILATSSTMRFLPRNFNDASMAAAELDTVLNGVRHAAFALSNIPWGLNKDDYKNTMSELTSAGMQLADFKDEAERAYAVSKHLSLSEVRSDASKATDAVEQLTMSTVHLAKAYATNMGVSMQEVSALMGEMKGQMGMPLESIRLAFGKIAADAEEAGVEGNQFFNIIRGMSADMNLFNNRMEIAGKVLSKLMKVMDPRHAQQFLQEIGSFFKSRDIGSRVKDVMSAGIDKTKVILEERLEVSMKSLTKELEGSGVSEEELRSAVSKGTAHLGKFFVSLEQSGKKLSAGQREAIIMAAQQQQKLSRGGVGDVASAVKDLDAIGSAMMLQAKSQGVLGKDIENLHDIELIAANNAIDLSDEQIDQYKKMLVGFDMAKEEMARRVETGTETTEDIELLKSIGAKGTAAEKANAVRHTASLKLMSKSTDANKAVLAQMEKTEDFAQKVGLKTISISEMLEQLMDWFMQKFFDAIMGIWKLISKWVGQGDSDKKIEVAELGRSKSKFVTKATEGAEQAYQVKEKLLSGDKSFSASLGKVMDDQTKSMGELTSQIAKSKEEYAKAQEKQNVLAGQLKTAKTPADKKKLEGELSTATKNVEGAYKRIEKLTAEKESIKKKKEDVVSAISVEVIKDKGTEGLVGEKGTITAMTNFGGTVGDMAKTVKSSMESYIAAGWTADKALKAAMEKGFQGKSEEEVANFQKVFAQQGMWNIDPKTLTEIVPKLEANLPAIKEMGEEAVKRGSIYTHDVHIEPTLANISSQLDTLSSSKLIVQDEELLAEVQTLRESLLEIRDGVQDTSKSDIIATTLQKISSILESLPSTTLSVQDALTAETLQQVLDALSQQGAGGGGDGNTAILQSIAAALGASDSIKTPDLSAAEDSNELSEEAIDSQKLGNASLADIYNVLRVKGIKINQSHLEGKYKKVITEGTQEAMETALFEYALMTDRKVAMKALDEAVAKKGTLTPSGILKEQLEVAKKHIKTGGYAKEQKAEAEAAEAEQRATAAVPMLPMAPAAAAPAVPSMPTSPAASTVAGEVRVNVHLSMTQDLQKFIEAKADAVFTRRSGAK